MGKESLRNFINSSSLGVYTKYLTYKNGHKYLVKSGRGDGEKTSSILEPVSECICYELAVLMGIPCAEYTLEEKNGTVFSVSKWFYNEEEESFYSANKLMRILKISRENLYNNLIENFPKAKQDIDNMIVFDYIVNNTDRHLKNFGFLENHKEIKLSPLYDNGLSLGAHIDEEELASEDMEDLILDSDYSKCFESNNRKQLDLVEKCTLNLDIDYNSVVDKYSKYLSDKRIDFIKRLLEDRIKVVKKCFQNQ